MTGTLFEQLWSDHRAGTRADGRDLIYMDRHVAHELHSPRAFARLRETGRKVRRPDLTYQALDHSVSTFRPAGDTGAESPFIVAARAGCEEFGVHVFDVGDPEHGISHVVGPELGLTTPGSSYACPDSHACTVGALGVLAFGVGTSELEHVFATQVLALKPLKTMRVFFLGTPAEGVTAKDLILKAISVAGADGGRGHAVEYAGPAIEALGMEGRMTICNMAIEMGARTGLIAPDETTIEWLAGRPLAPQGFDWDSAADWWRTLKSSPDAAYDKEVVVDCEGMETQISWGTDPSQVVGASQRVPDPADAEPARKEAMARALSYMDLKPGTPLSEIAIDRVFIGSCTNSRLSDLEEAATVLRGHKVAEGVKAVVTPGSSQVKRDAEARGLDKVFKEAGFFWGESACSMCAGGMGDAADPGDRCISTTNRNFENRQGPGVRTHLASPANVAASAVTGRITSARKLLAGD